MTRRRNGCRRRQLGTISRRSGGGDETGAAKSSRENKARHQTFHTAAKHENPPEKRGEIKLHQKTSKTAAGGTIKAKEAASKENNFSQLWQAAASGGKGEESWRQPGSAAVSIKEMKHQKA